MIVRKAWLLLLRSVHPTLPTTKVREFANERYWTSKLVSVRGSKLIIELVYDFVNFLWKIIHVNNWLHHSWGSNVLKASRVFLHDAWWCMTSTQMMKIGRVSKTLSVSLTTMVSKFSYVGDTQYEISILQQIAEVNLSWARQHVSIASRRQKRFCLPQHWSFHRMVIMSFWG